MTKQFDGRMMRCAASRLREPRVVAWWRRWSTRAMARLGRLLAQLGRPM